MYNKTLPVFILLLLCKLPGAYSSVAATPLRWSRMVWLGEFYFSLTFLCDVSRPCHFYLSSQWQRSVHIPSKGSPGGHHFPALACHPRGVTNTSWKGPSPLWVLIFSWRPLHGGSDAFFENVTEPWDCSAATLPRRGIKRCNLTEM